MAPESLCNNFYSLKSDIWSLGVVFYEMLYAKTPFEAETEQDLANIICNVPVFFPSTPYISAETKDFIS